MTQSTEELILDMAAKARTAAKQLATSPEKTRTEAISSLAQGLLDQKADILEANQQDLINGKNLSDAMKDRLALDEDRLTSAAKGLEAVAALPDPVGDVIASWDRPNGLNISRVRTPLGVIAIIYESRPLVTVDAAALCLKAGNAAILRPGSDSLHTSKALGHAMKQAFTGAGLPDATAQVVPTPDRDAVGTILSGAKGSIDIVVPRGGRSLVERVQKEARIPVIGHLEGLCHVYIDRDADLEMAANVTVNAKMRRTGICGAAETLLIDHAIANTAVPALVTALQQAGCKIRGDDEARHILPNLMRATEEDWYTEYLAPIMSLAIVNGVEGAIRHIDRYGSGHTDSIITANQQTADHFLSSVDSAIVMHNSSTQFADGGEFGMGAEIGIATGRLHARGPVGAEQLTTFKYVVRGTGQTRP